MSTFFPGHAINKDPDASLPYGMDWSDWLDEGDTVSTSVWAIDDAPDADLTVASDSIVDGVPTVWLAGGTVGQTYRVRNRITTGAGAVDDRSFLVKVRDR